MVEIWLKYPAPTMGFPPAPVKVDYETKVFSGGEIHVKIQQKVQYHKPTSVELRVKLVSSEDVMRLLMITAACREQWPNRPIHLIMPYLPYARQDRLCDRGEAFSLKVFAQLINAQNYASVKVYDCHSLVGLALLDRVEHVEQHQIIPKEVFEKYDCIVAPDLGAVKKAEKVAEKAKLPLLVATKQRDPTSGKLSKPKLVDGDPFGLKCLIVDDIADGGTTFINLADILYQMGANNVGLYVTHGIFSKGFAPLADGGITEIITTDSFTDCIANIGFNLKFELINIFN